MLSEQSSERTALVVGGASGIGWAVAKGLAAEGCQLTVADLNADGAVARAEELDASHAAVDVTDEGSVAALFEQTGPLDVVVNTAGIGGVGPITELPLGQFRSVVDVSLIGGFLVLKHAGRRLRDGGSFEGVALIPGAFEEYVENTPLGRVGTPADVADAVLFLCSDKASWVTGEVLDINGGAHLKRYPDILAHLERMTSST